MIASDHTVSRRTPSIGVELPEPNEPTPEELFLIDALREERRRRRTRSGERPRREHRRRAALTMVQNEAVFLPIWLRYYSRFFGPDDLYVLDHDTSDGSTDRDGFV